MKTLKFILILVLSVAQLTVFAQREHVGTVKNVIIMIPDGTSTGLVALSRWYNDNNPLAIDPYICGMVRTHNSDGRFPDSAPTSTAYATGVKTKAPYIGIDCNAEPRASVLELARRKGLSTGVVVTCEFPHATPADFVCHYNNRESGEYKNLAKQFIYNSPTLVFAGGKKYIDKNHYQNLLGLNGIELITDTTDFNRINKLPQQGKSSWALFPDRNGLTEAMSYECDRDAAKAPGLSEITAKAIEVLEQNKNGFFLMVEGSQVDWAAHKNDPYAAVNEFLEFDKAVAVAIKFAKETKNTVVIVCPDHGTGGISIGNLYSGSNLDIKEKIIDPLKKVRWSSRRLAETMLKDPAYMSKDSLKAYYNTDPAEGFLDSLNYAAKKNDADALQYLIGENFSRKNFIGWTTTGHTAEDVFLAIYAPEPIQKITGVIDNYEIGRYIAKILNLGDLDKATEELFKKYTTFFNDNEIISLNPDSLVVTKNGKRLTFESNSNVLKINGEKQEIRLPSITVWIDGVYYLPESIKYYFK